MCVIAVTARELSAGGPALFGLDALSEEALPHRCAHRLCLNWRHVKGDVAGVTKLLRTERGSASSVDIWVTG